MALYSRLYKILATPSDPLAENYWNSSVPSADFVPAGEALYGDGECVVMITT
jgi:hypothetical protein